MSTDIEFDAWQRNHFASIMAHMRAAGNNDPVLSGMIQSAIKGAWQAARATPLAPTPAAAEGQVEARTIVAPEYRRLLLAWRCADSIADLESTSAELTEYIDARLNAAPLPRQAAVQGEDTARLDWLEQAAESLGGLMLHDGQHPAPGRNGLGLRYMGRTLRQAVDSVRGVEAAKIAPATTGTDA